MDIYIRISYPWHSGLTVLAFVFMFVYKHAAQLSNLVGKGVLRTPIDGRCSVGNTSHYGGNRFEDQCWRAAAPEEKQVLPHPNSGTV